jgi:hypothetical protein
MLEGVETKGKWQKGDVHYDNDGRKWRYNGKKFVKTRGDQYKKVWYDDDGKKHYAYHDYK